MKTIDQINDILINYDNLINHIDDTIKIMKEIDAFYNTHRGIKDIHFDNSYVTVVCDDSFDGYYDTIQFSFPKNYLTLSVFELKDIVLKDKIIREEKERIKKENDENEIKKIKEQKELELYKKLKEKFQ
jgi:hypothetical protein